MKNFLMLYVAVRIVTSRLYNFHIIKPTRCTDFSILFWNETACFGQFLCPSSGVFHCTHSNGIRHISLRTACKQDQDGTMLILLKSCQQTCMTYTIAVCTVKNSLRWTEELSEARRVSFQNRFEKLVHLVGFIVRYLSRCTVTWTSNENYTSRTKPDASCHQLKLSTTVQRSFF